MPIVWFKGGAEQGFRVISRRGPIVAGLGAGWTLTASGAATVALAAVAAPIWRRGQ
jgi:hypothetical protein